jgi:hypothetical protein
MAETNYRSAEDEINFRRRRFPQIKFKCSVLKNLGLSTHSPAAARNFFRP